MKRSQKQLNKTRVILIALAVSFVTIAVQTVSSAVKDVSDEGGYIIGKEVDYSEMHEAPVKSQTVTREEKENKKSSVIRSVQPREIAVSPKNEKTSLKKESVQVDQRQYESQISMKDRKIQLLEARIKSLTEKLKQQESDFYMLQFSQNQRYEVRKGDSLWKIAARDDTYANPYMWIKIYNANMNKIDDPNRIYPGQLFDLPR